MTEVLVPQLVRSSLLRLQETVGAVTPPTPDPILREILDGCSFVADMLLRAWDYLRDRLTFGMEKTQCLTVLKDILNLIEKTSETLGKVREAIGSNSAVSRNGSKDLIRLEESIKQVEALHQRATAMLQWMETPLPPIDLSKLPNTEEELKQRKFLTLKEVLADL